MRRSPSAQSVSVFNEMSVVAVALYGLRLKCIFCIKNDIVFLITNYLSFVMPLRLVYFIAVILSVNVTECAFYIGSRF